jgi:DNA replication protein DnaC
MVSLKDEIAEIIPAGLRLSDEQWKEHDARIKEQLMKEQREQAEQERRERLNYYMEAGFPKRAIRAAEAADVSREAIACVDSWDWRSENVLVLSGAAGCGKTVAATRWSLSRPYPPAFVTASAFARESRYEETKRGWIRSGAMVLDDLGVEYDDAKGSFRVDLDELINTFYGNEKPLIITTNCLADEFKRRYGARVVDRLRESGQWCSIRESSMRKSKEER